MIVPETSLLTAPAVRLWTPSDSGIPRPAIAWTVSRFYERWFTPRYITPKRLDPKTAAEYSTAISRWRELTGDPPLPKVRGRILAEFVEADLLRPGKHEEFLSPNTVRKHCTHLQMVLNMAGPRCHDYPGTAKIYGLFGLDKYGHPRPAPRFTKPAARDKLPTDHFTLDEICDWLGACDAAVHPLLPNCSPAQWWRALIRFTYNTGMRIGSVMALRRDWVHAHDDGWGWAEIPARAAKQGRPQLIYLSPNAMEALEGIPTSDVVFPWDHSSKHLHWSRRRLLEAAGIPASRRYGFHGLRKALGTALWQIDRKVAQVQLGHKDERTTKQSYASPASQILELAATLAPVVDRVPQPAAKHQQNLF